MFKRFQPHIDYPLLFAILTLITLSTLSVWSASSFSEPIIERHLVRAALAIGALIFMSCISPFAISVPRLIYMV